MALEKSIEKLRMDLDELAFDLSITWSSLNDMIWRLMDNDLWLLSRNPCLVLSSVSDDHSEGLLRQPTFRAQLQALSQTRYDELNTPGWFHQSHRQEQACCIAYFSMEFMLSDALPIYSGGLGNVAGDQLKAASDLGVPVTAVGMLWQHGYFRQEFDSQGHQQALYPVNDTRQMPVRPLLDGSGNPVRLACHFPGWTIWLRGWQVNVGRNRLLLIDTNDPANPPPVRLIAGELYGGDLEMRLRQELVLGIGGWRLLEAAGVEPDVLHLNDGHAAFAVLERALSYQRKHNVDFEVALTATRAGNLFTTHTPVTAGFDRFPPALIEKYLGHYIQQELAQPVARVISLGQEQPGVPDSPFNMAWLAGRAAGAINAVSELHGATSRRIFEPLYPRWPAAEVPIGHVTNGIHLATWIGADALEAWKHWHKGQPSGGEPELSAEQALSSFSDQDLWNIRRRARSALLDYSRDHLARQRAIHGASLQQIDACQQWFDPDILTLGFARRFATYKRPNLLLHDPQRLLNLIQHSRWPVQLLVAGKAHPADLQGQAMLAQWHAFIRDTDSQGRIAFLDDYDMRVAQHLVSGVDVWINTPRRPWEASGTSGMKILANGGLNLSQLDGWWAEAYEPGLGWAIGDGSEEPEADPGADARDAEQLYQLLENEIIPTFYEHDADGLPRRWIQHIRSSMSNLVQEYSADRAVREYTERYYLPGALRYRERTKERSAVANLLRDRLTSLDEHWDEIKILDTRITRGPALTYKVEVAIDTGALPVNALCVQLYAEQRGHAPAQVLDMTLKPADEHAQTRLYVVEARGDREIEDFTVRIIPGSEYGLAVPLESQRVHWAS
ncbi:starch phosphorylase [Pseudomonas synxantha]|uniref:Glycosyltransferase family protein n=1 Tax=Pseudomonas synxantha TaxID=47883 RepID=A0AAX3IB62_9PSED|nr:alpha-glucan family phosphorylase [Pseudomonas synxantha]SDU44321.1 starch phosphorylase [Pseudomonas synxantha]VTR02327.1 glycosyltransferase family protein [Pseudomonas synxantha]